VTGGAAWIHEDEWGQRELGPRDTTVALAACGITLDALRAELGDVQQRALTTGYSGTVEPVTNGFAFRCSAERYWDQLYGIAEGGIVTQLHLTYGTPAITDLLHRLGVRFALVLDDPSNDGPIDLSDRAAVDHYLAGDANA